MSYYDREFGTVTIPAAQWASFKKALREGYNCLREKDFKALSALYDAVSASSKTVASCDLSDRVAQEVVRVESISPGGVYKYPVYSFSLLEADDCRHLLVTFNEKTRKTRLVKPSSKSFPYPAADRNSTKLHVFDDASIVFDNARRTVTWQVPEGNNAVQRASDSAMGRLFFRLLNKITWTRDSGGVFYRNDEENQSGSDGGDGHEYVAARFGPSTRKD